MVIVFFVVMYVIIGIMSAIAGAIDAEEEKHTTIHCWAIALSWFFAWPYLLIRALLEIKER